jgi:hypothetical protein
MTGPEPAPPGAGRHNEIVRQLAAGLANVAVLGALLVYFGWQRAEVHAELLGFDESILGMSARDYMLRSVGSVIRLLLIVGVTGLAWLWLDSRLVARIRTRGPADPLARSVLRLLPLGWVILPGMVLLAGFVPGREWHRLVAVAFPFSIGLGVLLLPYAIHLRTLLPTPPEPPAEGREMLLRGFTALIVGVTLFWGTARYAERAGYHLADDWVHRAEYTSVVAYSQKRLHLDAPGAQEKELDGSEGDYRYRYDGLNLLEHTGGRYFLVSEDWTVRHGVVLVLDDDDTIRLEFARNRP